MDNESIAATTKYTASIGDEEEFNAITGDLSICSVPAYCPDMDLHSAVFGPAFGFLYDGLHIGVNCMVLL